MTRRPGNKPAGEDTKDTAQAAPACISFDYAEVSRFVDCSDVWHNELGRREWRDRIEV